MEKRSVFVSGPAVVGLAFVVGLDSIQHPHPHPVHREHSPTEAMQLWPAATNTAAAITYMIGPGGRKV